MAFDYAYVLFIAPAAAVAVIGLALWARATRIRRAGRWSNALAEAAARHGLVASLLLGLAALGAAVALAGPRWGTRVVETETKGLSLVLAIDISRSMLAEDVAPSRLMRAQREARRLIHDLAGDRIGLVAFAGESFTLSPLTIDGSALHLMVDALHPDLTSAGGSELARAIHRGRELLLAGDEVADRVLVVFTDGEAHDSLPDIIAETEQLRRVGVHLILVAEGGREPARIPVRDETGELIGYQRDPAENVVATRRRDDILSAVADAARGMFVSAEVNDQAGAVREMVLAFKRAPTATTTAAQDVSRAWIPLLVAVLALLLHTVTRRTAALAGVVLSLATATDLQAQAPRNAADRAWLDGDHARAAALYLEQASSGSGGDTVWFNLGTAAWAAGDSAVAVTALERAAGSVDPAVRFRARYNLGLFELQLAARDSLNQIEHLEAARSHYREALLLRPGDANAKWNLEVVLRRMPQSSGAASATPPSGGEAEEPLPPQGLSVAQAEQILNSIAEEERRARQRLLRNRSALRETRGRRDW